MSPSTLNAVERQLEAMSADLFEVGLYRPGPGDGPEMLPRSWDAVTLLKSVPWLRYQNSQGRNIYIRPKGEHHLSLVDDLNAKAVQRMSREGFAPCLIVETSPDNFQAWLNHGCVLPKAESTAAARALAERFSGDRGAADWRHFGRLAGFTNRKEKYRGADNLFPFTRLVVANPGLVYAQAGHFLDEIRANLESSQRRAIVPVVSRPGEGLQTIDDFRARTKYAGDGNRIDLAYAVYAISHGVPEAAVRAAIASRDLSKKGTEARQAGYIDRTIKNAKDRGR